MNHREPTHGPKGVRRALHCLAFLLPALATESLPAAVRPRAALGLPSGHHGTEPAAYLPALGAPPLRFAEVAPPPDLVSRPAAAAPPQPALSMTESSVALANAAAAQSAAIRTSDTVSSPEPKAEATASAAAKPAPSSILPDENRPQVRPEDFLPFFQIPGSATQPGDVTLVVPVPRNVPAPVALPTSSATYTQTQK